VEVRAIIEEKSEEKQWTVPIQLTPTGWKAVIEPLDIKVTARGPISKIRALKASEFTATIGLLELKPGQVQLPVKLQLPPEIALVSQEPAEVKVISIEKPPQDELSRPTLGGSIPKSKEK
jgi:YbbR domain-containing protein